MPEELYKTERKREISKLNKAGEVETFYRIFATSKGGTYFHIDVREDKLDTAPKLLEAKAKQLDEV